MTEYSDEQADKNEKLVRSWLQEFSKTQAFESLSYSQKENAVFIIEFFTDYMFGYEEETPEEWSRHSLNYVCTYIFPRKISADKSCFLAVEPVLKEFFQFLASRQYLAQASELASAMKGLSTEIVAASENPWNWGMAKSMVMGFAPDS